MNLILKIVNQLDLIFRSINDLQKLFDSFDRTSLNKLIDQYGTTFLIKGWKSKTSKAEGTFTIDPLFLCDTFESFIIALEARKWNLADIIDIIPQGYKSTNSDIVTANGKKIKDKRFLSDIEDFKDANDMFFRKLKDVVDSIATINLAISALPDVVEFNSDIFRVYDNLFLDSLVKSIIGRLKNKITFAKVDDVISFIKKNNVYFEKLQSLFSNDIKSLTPQSFKGALYNFILDLKDDLIEQDVHISRNIIDDIIAGLLDPKFLLLFQISDINALLKKAKHLMDVANDLKDVIDVSMYQGKLKDWMYIAEIVARLDFKKPIPALKLLVKKYMEFNPNSVFLDNFNFLILWVVINNKSILQDILESVLSYILLILKRFLIELIDVVGDKLKTLLSPF